MKRVRQPSLTAHAFLAKELRMYVEGTTTQQVGVSVETSRINIDEAAEENAYREGSYSFSHIAKLPFFASLTPMQRVMLLSNGTLTDILQAFTLEEMGVQKLSEEQRIGNRSDFLELVPPEEVLERSVILYGKKTSRAYVYAESLIALGRLPRALARELQTSSEPLGRLQLKHRLETFKELLDVRLGESERASTFLRHHSRFLIRSYRVFVNARPCMIIHEYFPTL
jgi:chorismate-pyruvate lyase